MWHLDFYCDWVKLLRGESVEFRAVALVAEFITTGEHDKAQPWPYRQLHVGLLGFGFRLWYWWEG